MKSIEVDEDVEEAVKAMLGTAIKAEVFWKEDGSEAWVVTDTDITAVHRCDWNLGEPHYSHMLISPNDEERGWRTGMADI